MKFPARFIAPLHELGKRKEMGVWLIKYGALIAVFLFFFVPIQGRFSGYVAEKNSLKKQTEELKKIVSSLLSPEEIKMVGDRVEYFESKLADETKTSNILDQITQIAANNHLKMIQIYSDSPELVKDDAGKELEVGGKKLNLLPVNFRVEADFKNLADFLKSLTDDSKWTFTVESMLVQRSSTEDGSLQCDLTLSFISR